MPEDTQASIPACSRAPAQPRDAVALCPCRPLTLETKALSGCETHPHAVHIYIKVHAVHKRGIHKHGHTRVPFIQIRSSQTTQPAIPLSEFFYACNIVQQTETYF